MDERRDKNSLGDKPPDSRSMISGDGAGDIGSVPRDDTVRRRIIVKEGRRRESLKKRGPSKPT
jgi:hypothetical protein